MNIFKNKPLNFYNKKNNFKLKHYFSLFKKLLIKWCLSTKMNFFYLERKVFLFIYFNKQKRKKKTFDVDYYLSFHFFYYFTLSTWFLLILLMYYLVVNNQYSQIFVQLKKEREKTSLTFCIVKISRQFSIMVNICWLKKSTFIYALQLMMLIFIFIIFFLIFKHTLFRVGLSINKE